MAEYRLTPAAERDLETIWIHTHQQWSIEQANHYTDILTAAFVELALSPSGSGMWAYSARLSSPKY